MLNEKQLVEIGYALTTASEEDRNWKNDCREMLNHIREIETHSGQWIDIKDRLPDYKKNPDGSEADNSEKVFTKDKNGNLYIMELWYEQDAEGCLWANCYGDIDGDAEIDDDYAEIITHWMPLPKP